MQPRLPSHKLSLISSVVEKKTYVKSLVIEGGEAALERHSCCTDDCLLQRHGGLIREHNDTIRMRKGCFRCPHCGGALPACSPEQHRLFPLWQQDVACYMELVGTHGLPEEDRPRQCPKCRQCEHTPHRHSHYERMVFTLSHSGKICIFRFRCPDCGYVHSVIPAFLEPYQQIALDLQEDWIDAAEQGRTVEAVAETTESLPCGGFDEHTIAGLIRAWNARLAQLESGLWAWLLARIPHLTLPRSPSLWGTLRNAWQAVRKRIPEFRNIRFLHGLNRLCFSMTVAVHG